MVMLSDHAELAAPEQAQREAVRGAAGGSSVDPDTRAPVDCGIFLAPLTERLFSRQASSHQQLFLFFLSRNATCFGLDHAAGLNAFDYHLLEKRMLLEAACVQTNAPSRSSHLQGPSIPPAWNLELAGSSAAPAQGSSSQACHPLACCAYPSAAPSAPERQLPSTPAVGPLSSEATVPMLWRLWSCLKPAQTVLVCPLCPITSARDIHCINTAAVVAQRWRPVYSTQHSNRLQRRSIHGDSSPGWPEAGC